MLITSVLATMSISKPKDNHGVEKPFDPPYILAGLVRYVWPIVNKGVTNAFA